MSIYEQIVPRVVLEGWPLDMLVDPAEQKQAIDFIANECKCVATPSHICQFRYLDLSSSFCALTEAIDAEWISVCFVVFYQVMQKIILKPMLTCLQRHGVRWNCTRILDSMGSL